mgnify:CR=1 FL=1
MENSIEEDIKIVENYLANSAINEIDSNFFKNGGWEIVDLEIPKSMQHILSDYKRVLKENEELKEDRKNNNEMIALAQNEILNYMSGYEEGKKHKMTAVAQVVENQQYYIIKKQMEKYEEHIKRLQKENEELKERIREHTLLISPYYVKENVIPVQKVKDKIEEYKDMLKTCNKAKDIDRIKTINERILELEELLEGRK